MTNAQKKLIEHPDFEKVNIFMGGIYLLTSIQNLWWDEVEDLLRKHGALTFDFKQGFNIAKNATDRFERSMKDLLEDDKTKLNIDFDALENYLRNYLFEK